MSEYKVVWYNGDEVVCALAVKRGKMRVGQQEALAIEIAKSAQPLEPHTGWEVVKVNGVLRHIIAGSESRLPL